jgi:hypothetical protein
VASTNLEQVRLASAPPTQAAALPAGPSSKQAITSLVAAGRITVGTDQALPPREASIDRSVG